MVTRRHRRGKRGRKTRRRARSQCGGQAAPSSTAVASQAVNNMHMEGHNAIAVAGSAVGAPNNAVFKAQAGLAQDAAKTQTNLKSNPEPVKQQGYLSWFADRVKHHVGNVVAVGKGVARGTGFVAKHVAGAIYATAAAPKAAFSMFNP